jgi:hypothetical protein
LIPKLDKNSAEGQRLGATEDYGAYLTRVSTKVDASGNYAVSWPSDGRPAGQDATVYIVKYDLYGDPDLIADDSTDAGKTLAAESAAWFWRFDLVKPGNGNDANEMADRNDFKATWDKVNKPEEQNTGGSRTTAHNARLKKLAVAQTAIFSGNSYGNIRDALSGLGIRTKTSAGYEDKVGITLSKRKPVAITEAQSLLAGAAASDTPASTDNLQGTLTSNPESTHMPLPALPNAMPVSAHVTTSSAAKTTASIPTYGTCQIASKNASGGYLLTPETFLIDLPGVLTERLRRADVDFPPTTEDLRALKKINDAISVKILENPRHGRLEPATAMAGMNLSYYPDYGFEGTDQLSVFISGEDYAGNPVSLVMKYFIGVVPDDVRSSALQSDATFEKLMAKECPVAQFSWRMAGVSTSRSPDVTFSFPPSFDITFSDLSGAAVGEESTSSAGETITLDTNATGYGWFVDSTPDDNSEFLPTSNPNEWSAKVGSPAYGTMDLYTVLLHEYGHALGLDHSPDVHNFMAAILQPGMRHVLSEADLAEITQLAGLPAPDPGQPLPPLPYDLSLMALALRRKQAAGGMLAEAGSNNTLGTLAPHYDVVVNPTLANSDFNGTTGWTTTGSVSMADGSAVLSESAASQTRINQVFTVGPNDKFLRFTVADTSLDNPGDLPEDAFEAALLDANTGASLLDPISLSDTDTFLNLQGDGQAFLSDAVRVIANADGSRTYVVDLSGIATGTAVNLSFDLLGFGEARSHVTIRDLHIGETGGSVNFRTGA